MNTTTNASGLPGIPFQYHSAYDVRYRNAAISMDSDDISLLNNEEEYSERSIYLPNDKTTGEDYNYNYNRLQKPSSESISSLKTPKLEDYINEGYSGRSNDRVTSEGYESVRLPGLPKSPRSPRLGQYSNEVYSPRLGQYSNELYSPRLEQYNNELHSGRSTYLSNDTIAGEAYNYNRLLKPSIGLPGSPRLNAYDNNVKSGSITPRSNKLTPQSSKAGFLSPKSSKPDLLTPQSDKCQLPSPTPSAEEDNDTIKKKYSKVLPSIPTKNQHDSFKLQQEHSPSSNKKQKRYFSLGKSFTSLVSSTRPKFRSYNKKSNSLNTEPQNMHDISHSTPIITEGGLSEVSLPALTRSSSIFHQLPEKYFPKGFDKDEGDRPEEVNTTNLTVDELYKLVLNMQKVYRQLINEVKELKLEIRRLKGEEVSEESEGQNVGDVNGKLRSVRSFTRQMERYGGEGRWFHNE